MSERSKLILKKGLEQFEREEVQLRHVSIFYNLTKVMPSKLLVLLLVFWKHGFKLMVEYLIELRVDIHMKFLQPKIHFRKTIRL